MFWAFLIVCFIGIFLINLGALSVLVAVLAMAFKASLLVIILLVVLLAWRWCRNKRTSWRKL